MVRQLTRLDPKRREIRLARIEPHLDFDHPISCFLETVFLDDKPQYEALSYVWGDAKVTTLMMLERERFPITMNLDLGLRYIRDGTKEKLLWIDAICINQYDIEERNSQVRLMRDVYENADTVRIWLGECTDTSIYALQILETLSSDNTVELRQLVDAAWNMTQASGTIQPGADIQAVEKLAPKAFRDIAFQAWWRRMWVIQEVTLARKATFHLGSRVVDVRRFVAAFWVFVAVYVELHGSVFDCWEDAEELQAFDVLFRSLQNLAYLDSHRNHADDWHEFFCFLAASRAQFATDERDKVYGLLGLCPTHLRVQYLPNYNHPIEEVYQTFAFETMTLSRSFALFNQIMVSQNTITALPSWVPDWKTPHDFEHATNRLTGQRDLYMACGNRSFALHSLEGGRILRVRGMVIDTILRKSEPFPDQRAIYAADIHKALVEFRRFCGVESAWGLQSRYVMGGSRGDAYWRTLVGDTVNHGISRCKPEDRESFDRWWKGIEQGQIVERTIRHAVRTAVRGRRVVTSSKGYIGLAPSDTVEGDVICILAGGLLPCILRRKISVAQNTFTLVGEAYVHGIMYGEAASLAPQETDLSTAEELRLKAFGGHPADRDRAFRTFEDTLIA